MFQILKTRLHQGRRTAKYPEAPITLPERYCGRPKLHADKCRDGCHACEKACPVEALGVADGPTLDLGRCVFCNACAEACPTGAIERTRDHRMAVSRRADLVLRDDEVRLAERMADDLHRVLGRALRLREVSAGSCNACDLDTNVLNTVGWDLSRFGVQFVASPRHADGVLVTGAVSRNMRHALLETYAAVPSPRVVIAVGACAISGGPFRGSPDVLDGVEGLLPVDLYVPGCPPHPLSILDGLLRLLGRVS